MLASSAAPCWYLSSWLFSGAAVSSQRSGGWRSRLQSEFVRTVFTTCSMSAGEEGVTEDLAAKIPYSTNHWDATHQSCRSFTFTEHREQNNSGMFQQMPLQSYWSSNHIDWIHSCTISCWGSPSKYSHIYFSPGLLLMLLLIRLIAEALSTEDRLTWHHVYNTTKITTMWRCYPSAVPAAALYWLHKLHCHWNKVFIL